ncbi:MAG: hypothetical protein HW387_437 [Parachlamydiales bacterium]|nr:hypothetical protein [Parachlamydiales bacterium]
MSEPLLYLLPNLLDEELPHEPFLPISVANAVLTLNGLIAESEKSARRFLRRFVGHDQMAAMPIELLNEHTRIEDMARLLDPIAKGQVWGIVSDAGLPCIADPGAPLVRLANERGIRVVAIPGPCSLILALQLSGLNAQRFAFHGYLPRDREPLLQRLRHLGKVSSQDDSTQVWIEAPYRSAKMFEAALEALQPNTALCVALSLTLARQRVCTRKVSEWRKQPISIEKEPAVFLATH